MSIFVGIFFVIWHSSKSRFTFKTFYSCCKNSLILAFAIMTSIFTDSIFTDELALAKQNLHDVNNNFGRVTLVKSSGNPPFNSPVNLPNNNIQPSSFPTPGNSNSRRANLNLHIPIRPPVGVYTRKGNNEPDKPDKPTTEFDNLQKQSEQISKNFNDDYYYQKKQLNQQQCKLDDEYSELSDNDKLHLTENYIIQLDGKASRQAFTRVWKNDKARKELISALDRINRGELLPRNAKRLTTFLTLREFKFNKVRMIIKPGNPLQILAVCMKKDFAGIEKAFRGKYA